MKILRRCLLPVLAAMTVAACGSDGGTPVDAGALRSQGGPNTPPLVEIERSRYLPPSLNVAPGTTVEFVNLDPYAHTVTGRDDDSAFVDSGNMGQDDVYTVTFDEAGTYRYFCEIHPTMRAELIVG